jgi:hypothetical protein
MKGKAPRKTVRARTDPNGFQMAFLKQFWEPFRHVENLLTRGIGRPGGHEGHRVHKGA